MTIFRDDVSALSVTVETIDCGVCSTNQPDQPVLQTAAMTYTITITYNDLLHG